MSNWDYIYKSENYRRLIARKKRCIVAMTMFFLVYYFALPISVGYWPELMARQLWGYVNLAYVFAFSQFLMTWSLAYLYMRYAARFDRSCAEILADAKDAADGGGA